jgi:hypothetical protein
MRALYFIFLWWRVEPEVRSDYFGEHTFAAAVTGVIWLTTPVSALVLLQGGWKWSLGLTAAFWVGGLLYLYPAMKRAERHHSASEGEAS